MERIEVVGMRNVDFTDNKGRHVDGTSIYYLIEDTGVTGKMTGKLFISRDRKINTNYFPAVGDVVAVSYDRYGKPVDFELI